MPKPEFHLVNDNVPPISKELLVRACAAQDVTFVEHNSRSFVFTPAAKVKPGNMLFRPAISLASQRVEQYLYQPGVATFYKQEWGVLHACTNALALYEAHGIPVPRYFHLLNSDRRALDYYVEQLGGYPVILKVLGHSRGIGVMKVDNAAGLYSVADYLLSSAQTPLLCSFIPDAVHWRCVVVGDKVVAAYRNPVDTGDFRTYGSSRPEDIFDRASPELEQLTVQTASALELDFGGVDILQHPSGRCYVLECNFPCYYAHAQEHAGIDVAGRMLEFLRLKAERLVRGDR